MTERPDGRVDRTEVAAAMLTVAVGGGLAALVTARTWTTVTAARAAPLGPLRIGVSGRTLQAPVLGLAVVALAGVLALLASRGVLRRVVGAVLLLAGVGVIWRAVLGLSAVSDAHARQLVIDSRTGVTLGSGVRVAVATHAVWPLLAVLGGGLIALGGGLTMLRGGRWRAMSARYESPVRAGADAEPARSAPDDPAAADVARARADLALWQQLDRGEDPTAVPVDTPARPPGPSDGPSDGPDQEPHRSHGSDRDQPDPSPLA